MQFVIFWYLHWKCFSCDRCYRDISKMISNGAPCQKVLALSFISVGCTECVWAETAQQVVFVCPCSGVFKSNLRHKYMQQVSITSVHEICSSTKKPDKASEITINKQTKTLLYTLWRMYTQCKTIRQICVQSITFNCTHIQYSSTFQDIRSWSFKTRRDKTLQKVYRSLLSMAEWPS